MLISWLITISLQCLLKSNAFQHKISNKKMHINRLFGTSPTSIDQFNFLGNPDQTVYLSNILRRSTDAVKQCLKDEKKLIEIEFPANRKSDLSVTETLDTNRFFTGEFAKGFSNLGRDLWLVFPDRKECSLARSKYGDNIPFTLTSIEGVKLAPANERPKLMISVNPGFNVEEWIELVSITRGAPLVVINGNLDRLRNGYYPSFFYPGLTKVTKEFYSKATQALFLSPIAVGGNRYAAWLTCTYPNEWNLITKRQGCNDYELLESSETEPDPKKAWGRVKQHFADLGRGWF